MRRVEAAPAPRPELLQSPSMQPFRYAGFGLTLESNVRLPGLQPAKAHCAADVRLSIGATANNFPNLSKPLELRYASSHLTSDGRPQLELRQGAEGIFQLDYSDGTVVLIDQSGSQVWATWAPSATLEDLATYLLGPVLGLVLRLKKITCLHASCVALDDGCIAFVGASGAGKSSIAALFALHGHAVLTDDVLPLRQEMGEVYALPSYPRVRLWADSTVSLFGAADALPLIVAGWDKRYLDLTSAGYEFASAPMRLRAIYLLASGHPSAEHPAVRACDARDALVRLLANTYTSYVTSPENQARDLSVFGLMANRLPVHELELPATADNESLYKAVMRDIHTLYCDIGETQRAQRG